MNKTIELIKALSSDNSRTGKEQLLMDAFMNGERYFFSGARLAYDKLVTFGVQKVPLIDEEEDGEGTFGYQDFLELARKLSGRELTGHAARDALITAANASKVDVWNLFFRRVLLKDLKIGLEVKTINKILNRAASIHPEAQKYIIPTFGVQLAADGKKPENVKKLVGKRYLDVKLDGTRFATILDKENGTVTQYTRTGIPNENFPHIAKALRALMDELPVSVMLDGEMIGASFQELMKQMTRKDAKTEDMRLALFDIVPLNDFNAGLCKTPQNKRHEALCELQTSGLLAKHCGDSVYVNPKVLVDLATPEGQATMKEFNNKALAAGFEGTMIKDPNAPYEGKRSANWIKIKPKISVSLEVVAVQEGEADGKYRGTTGALVCEGTDDGFYIKTNVAAGLKDQQRDEIWADQNAVIGMIVEVEADKMTIAEGETAYSLRFPVFKGWRGTKKGEKL